LAVGFLGSLDKYRGPDSQVKEEGDGGDGTHQGGGTHMVRSRKNVRVGEHRDGTYTKEGGGQRW